MAERRYFNGSSLRDPAWNIGNCSEHTTYLQVDTELYCACLPGWTDSTCSTYMPESPYIRLIALQIIGGIAYFLLALLSLSIALAVVLRRPIPKPARLRIVASLFMFAAIVIRFVWLVDAGEGNEDFRYIPGAASGFLYWIPLGFCNFSAIAVVSLWYANLKHFHRCALNRLF